MPLSKVTELLCVNQLICGSLLAGPFQISVQDIEHGPDDTGSL